MNELERMKEEKKKSWMVYKVYNKTYDFRKFNTIRVFDDNIKNNFTNVSMANDEQSYSAKYIK